MTPFGACPILMPPLMSNQNCTQDPHEEQLDFKVACDLLNASGIFDDVHYRRMSGVRSATQAVEHYLKQGWREGIEPSPLFEGQWLYPYYLSAGLMGPPALTYVTLKAVGAPAYPNRGAAEKIAEVIRDSGLFDADYYSEGVSNIGELDPLLHYVIVGERLGYAPSALFDPAYYLRRYPDIGHSLKCLLEHYITIGRRENRRATSVASELIFDTTKIDPNRETVLLVSHQASRTGAPILAYNIAKRLSRKYNVVTLVLLPGELFSDFEAVSQAVIGPVTSEVAWVAIDGVAYAEGEYIAKRLRATYPIKYAIANSIDSRTLLKPLICEMIPNVTLIHEFAADVRRRGQPRGEMGRWLEWTNEIVFSADIVADSVREEYPHLVERPVHILPQGPCELPPRTSTGKDKSSTALTAFIDSASANGALIVLGCGTVFARKGVDLFVGCAARVAKLAPDLKIRFAWIGHRYDPARDKYSRELQKRISDEGLTGRVEILNEVTDLEPAYAATDIFFLSSRLDPLPNVGIDSALRGIPIVCFENTGGIADHMASDPITRPGVVPQFDVEAAAQAIMRLAQDDRLREETGQAVKRIADATFNMDQYAGRLDEIGQEAARIMRQRCADFDTIKTDSLFDMVTFLEPHTIETTREESIRLFLARAGALATSTQPTANFYFRRPCPGFHPQIYVHERKNDYDTKTENPLAHFIRSGKPDGPWTHDLITPKDLRGRPAIDPSIRIGIHGHFYYPEIFDDFMEKLAENSFKCDLLLSTSDDKKAKQLDRMTRQYRDGQVDIRIVPNRGRDIGAFLTGFAGDIGRYDIIGHLHSKRSLHTGDHLVGEKWREFLWQNLIGGLYPMADVIINRLISDDRIGLVFADDPHLSDWDLNRKIAEDVAKRMGRTAPLPPFFDFPIGTMFWARPRAVEPLLRFNFGWDDYPDEPAPLDGTVLHALERLLPFAAQEAGYRYATTFIPGMTW